MKIPNGWFLNGALFWGDSLAKDTVIAKGFYVELPDMSAASVDALHQLQEQLRGFLYTIGEGWAAQIQWTVDSDFRGPIDAYRTKTASQSLCEWGRYHRQMVGEGLWQKMLRGELRRERLVVFLAKQGTTIPKSVRTNEAGIAKVIASHVRSIEERIANLPAILPDAKIIPMDSREHYYWLRRFWNPSLALVSQDPARRYEGFRADDEIAQVLRSDGVPVDIEEGIAMQMDDHYHSLFVLRRWPQVSYPGIMRALTNAVDLDYLISQSIFPLSVDKEIAKAEKQRQRVAADAISERKHSLQTEADKLGVKIDKLAQGYTRPFRVLTIIRVWARTLAELVAKNAAIKAAVQSMSGGQLHQVNQAAQFRNLLCESVPGWLGGRVRQWDMYATSDYLPDLLPASQTFTGHLDAAEALYEGANGQVVGVRFFADGTPQHALLTGMTGAGKSVAVIDLLTQTEGDYAFTAIIEEGLSYAVWTRTQGCEPIVIRPDGELSINYFDTDGLPLTAGHLAAASALCLKMIGADYSSGDVNNRRTAMLSEYIRTLYQTGAEEWFKRQGEGTHEALMREALAVRGLQKANGHASTFLDSYLAFRELPSMDRNGLLAAVSDAEVLKALKTPETARLLEEMCYTRFSHEDYKTCGVMHSALVDFLRFAPFDFHDQEEVQLLATYLSAWNASGGKYGKLFDGVTNLNLRGRVAHFELGEIPESSKELKEAAGFLVSIYIRQHVVTMPRGLKKRLIFEEMARFLDVPEGGKIVAEAYAQFRKYGCLVISVTQVFSQLKKTPLFPVIRANSKIFLLMRQQDRNEVDELGDAIGLPPLARMPILHYPLPEHQPARGRFSSYTYFAPEGASAVCGTVRVRGTREMLFVASSSGKVFDERARALARHDNVLDAIIEESDRMSRAG